MALTRLTLLSSDLKIVGFAGYRYYKNTYVGEVGYAKVAAQSPAKEATKWSLSKLLAKIQRHSLPTAMSKLNLIQNAS